MSENGFRFGDWQIDPDSNTLRNGEASANVEPKAMDVLRYLCRHAGAVIPPEELLQACWGNADLGDNPIHKAITQLRRALGDSASEPRYIETVRKRGYRAIAPVMTGEAALEGSWQQGSPFRGLESFQESHAAIFFGRMQATAQLRELVLKQASDGCAMALVLGPSGSGKTSLVRAGLLPGLMASRTGSGEPVALTCTLYMDCADLADGNLFQALAAVLIDAEVGGKLLFAGENAEELGRWLESSDASTIAGRLAEASGKIKIGLFVDRLEAIFRAPGVTDEIRSRFIAVLEHLARSRAMLVMLACRNDFYPEVIALPLLMALKSRGGHFDLNPPDGAEIAQMVRMPAKAAGLKFEVDPATGASLDDVLCDAARGSPDALPLLQYCLNELYRQRSEDGTLRLDVFAQLGGIEGAIAAKAEQVVGELQPMQLEALPSVLSLLVNISEEQGTVTARRVAWRELKGTESTDLVSALVNARLFVSELAGDEPSFSVAHEALLRRWPRISNWTKTHRHILQIRNRVSIDATRWISGGRSRDLLLPSGLQITQAQALLENAPATLSSVELEYVQRSVDREKLRDRIRLALMTLIITLAVVIAVLGFAAINAQSAAERHRTEAEGLMGFMLGDFVDKLRPIGRLELLDEVSSRALVYLTTFKPEHEDIKATIQRVKALQVIAEVSIARGQSDKALTSLNLARELLPPESSINSINTETLKTVGTTAFWLARVHLGQSEWGNAEKLLKEYKDFSKKLVQLKPNYREGLTELAYANNSLGDLYMRRGELQNATEYFSEAIRLEERALVLQPDNLNLKADLANSLSFLASAKQRLGKLSEALSLYENEEALLAPLYSKDPANATWARRLAFSYWHQGDLKGFTGRQSDAAEQFQKSAQIYQALALKDTTNNYIKIKLNAVQLRLIDISPANGDLENRMRKLQENYIELIQLREKSKDLGEINQWIAISEREQAATLFKQGKTKEAKEKLEDAIKSLDSMYLANPENLAVASDLAIALILDSNLKNKNDKSENKNLSCQRALAILKHEALNSLDFRILSPYVRAGNCLDLQESIRPQQEKLIQMSFKDTYN